MSIVIVQLGKCIYTVRIIIFIIIIIIIIMIIVIIIICVNIEMSFSHTVENPLFISVMCSWSQQLKILNVSWKVSD